MRSVMKIDRNEIQLDHFEPLNMINYLMISPTRIICLYSDAFGDQRLDSHNFWRWENSEKSF